MYKYILLLLTFFTPLFGFAQGLEDAHAYIFTRDDCSHCQDLKEFIDDNGIDSSTYDITYLNLIEPEAQERFESATSTLGTGRVTPISFVNGEVYVGFSKDVLGEALLDHSKESDPNRLSYESYLAAETQNTGLVCEEDGMTPCLVDTSSPEITIPVFGTINPQTSSLTFLAIALGFVDGFNPCAMWVLLTFLLILSQVGSRKKMLQVAGLFILAEAVMYYFILNIWYQTWDFIALDGIVTPAVGILALGSGAYFVYKYFKSRGEPLTCDVASLEHQQKTENKIQKLVSKPMTLLVALAIIGLALSVNVIEFACSVGIPQAFTKILELNNLSFWNYQWYTLLYTIFYMVDDVIVFGLAIWGYKKFYAVGQKYSKISTIIAGVLMLILGVILVTNPDILSF